MSHKNTSLIQYNWQTADTKYFLGLRKKTPLGICNNSTVLKNRKSAYFIQP